MPDPGPGPPPRPADNQLLLVGSATAALGEPIRSNLTLLGSLSVHGTTARSAGDAVTLAPMSGSLGSRLGGRAPEP